MTIYVVSVQQILLICLENYPCLVVQLQVLHRRIHNHLKCHVHYILCSVHNSKRRLNSEVTENNLLNPYTPEKTIHWTCQRANIDPTLVQCIVFAGIATYHLRLPTKSLTNEHAVKIDRPIFRRIKICTYKNKKERSVIRTIVRMKVLWHHAAQYKLNLWLKC